MPSEMWVSFPGIPPTRTCRTTDVWARSLHHSCFRKAKERLNSPPGHLQRTALQGGPHALLEGPRGWRPATCQEPGRHRPAGVSVKDGVKNRQPKNDPAHPRRELSSVLNGRFSKCGPGTLGVSKTLSRDRHGQNQRESQDAVCLSTLALVRPRVTWRPGGPNCRPQLKPTPRGLPHGQGPPPTSLLVGGVNSDFFKIKICYLCNM